MEPLYEGKSKRLYPSENPNELVMEFKNDATAYNAAKHAVFEEKGRLNRAISTLLYQMLEEEGVATHFVRELDETRVVVHRVEIIGIEVIVRNVAAGSFCKRTGVEEGRVFGSPVIEFSLKDDALGDPLINDDYIRELGIATPQELKWLRESALKVNDLLGAFFLKAGLRLVDFKLEYGRLAADPATIVLADEISPDGCRLWDLATGEKMDKDRFRRDLGQVMEKYAEVLQRARHVLEN